MKYNFLAVCAGVALFAVTAELNANPFPGGFNAHAPLVNVQLDEATPGTALAASYGMQLVALGGDVTVDFLGPTTAIDTDLVFLSSPANGSGTFFPNHSTFNGTTVDLGSFAAGTVLEFGVTNMVHGDDLYSGSGSLNLDGQVHAYTQNDWQGYTNITYVAFEDLLASQASDWNYQDEAFAVQGAIAETPNTAVPEISSTASLLGFSLFGLLNLRRWLKK